MAEFDAAERINYEYQEYYRTDAMTGDKDARMQLYYQLSRSLRGAESVDIIVSFLMESGVKMIVKDLEKALKRGAKIRILTGNYLGITQPSALYMIKRELGEQIDLRFYNEKNRSFHPKSYIFHYKNYSEIYVGSSNISRSALTSGIEWNYRFRSDSDLESYEKFFGTFEDLFYNHSIVIDDEELKRYSRNWHRPAVAKDLDRYDVEADDKDTNVRVMYEPRGAQIEALCALEYTRQEGAKRALVVAATGAHVILMTGRKALKIKGFGSVFSDTGCRVGVNVARMKKENEIWILKKFLINGQASFQDILSLKMFFISLLKNLKLMVFTGLSQHH